MDLNKFVFKYGYVNLLKLIMLPSKSWITIKNIISNLEQ